MIFFSILFSIASFNQATIITLCARVMWNYEPILIFITCHLFGLETMFDLARRTHSSWRAIVQNGDTLGYRMQVFFTYILNHMMLRVINATPIHLVNHIIFECIFLTTLSKNGKNNNWFADASSLSVIWSINDRPTTIIEFCSWHRERCCGKSHNRGRGVPVLYYSSSTMSLCVAVAPLAIFSTFMSANL